MISVEVATGVVPLTDVNILQKKGFYSCIFFCFSEGFVIFAVLQFVMRLIHYVYAFTCCLSLHQIKTMVRTKSGRMIEKTIIVSKEEYDELQKITKAGGDPSKVCFCVSLLVAGIIDVVYKLCCY